MTERSSEQERGTWTILFTAAVVWIAVGVGWRGFYAARSVLAEESQGSPPKAQRLPNDLVGVSDAKYAPLEGLAPGSTEAQGRQRQAVQQLGLPLEVKASKTGIVFRLIPAGTFTMGSPKAEQDMIVKARGRHDMAQFETEHQVTLSKAFYCGKYEVTQGQWEEVMGSNPSEAKYAGKNAPVEYVCWDDCQEFVKRLCQMEGAPEGTYRLLTEAEWEYACRAGTQTALYNGEIYIRGSDDVPALDPIAWYLGNSGVDSEYGLDVSAVPGRQYDHKRAGPHPVGGKQANGFGLCDMIGNVSEWCQDRGGDYPNGPVNDPLGPPPPGFDVKYRVRRGGSWVESIWWCRSAARAWDYHDWSRNRRVGFRLARTAPSDP